MSFLPVMRQWIAELWTGYITIFFRRKLVPYSTFAVCTPLDVPMAGKWAHKYQTARYFTIDENGLQIRNRHEKLNQVHSSAT